MAPLVELRAGRAYRRGDTNFVDPAEGRGVVYLEEEDGLLHFYYKNLSTNSTSEEEGGIDLLLFPGDASFLPAKGSPKNSRISVLKFSSSNHRHFFWHQSLDGEGEEEKVKRFNELIGGTEEDEGMQVEETTATAPTAAPVQAPAVRSSQEPSEESLAQIRSIMAGFSKSGGSSSSFLQQNQTPEFTLPDVLPLPLLQRLLLTSPSLSHTLIPFLPSDVPQTPEVLQRTLESPELRRSLASLDRALRTGALGPLVLGLGLRERAGLGVKEFLEEVVRQAEAGDEKQEGNEEGMQE